MTDRTTKKKKSKTNNQHLWKQFDMEIQNNNQKILEMFVFYTKSWTSF